MSSQQSSTAVNRAAQVRLQELSARVAALEAKVAGHDSTITNHTAQLQSIETDKNQFARTITADLEAHTKWMDYLESVIRVGHESGHLVLPPGILEENEDDLGGSSHENGGGGANAALSSVDDVEIQKDPMLKTVILQTLHDLYGLPHLRDHSSIVYPAVLESDPEWPSATNENGERRPYMRFNFDQPYDEANNWRRIQDWANYVVDHGAETTPAARGILARLSRDQILTACKLRFNYLRKEFRRKAGIHATGAHHGLPQVPIDPALLDPGDAEAGSGAPPPTAISDLRSRAIGKSQMRHRKRNHLSGPHDKYKDAKYDAYFEPGAMSDDEDEYNLVEGVWVKSTEGFVSREWEFVSQELRDCRDAVDALPNPNEKARAVRRRRGDPKAGAPRKWEKPKWAMRKWMIDPDFLARNPDWLTSGLVLGNGPTWGEDEPAVNRPAKRSRIERNNLGTSAPGPGPSTEKARQARRALQEAQQRAREVRGEENPDDFAMHPE